MAKVKPANLGLPSFIFMITNDRQFSTASLSFHHNFYIFKNAPWAINSFLLSYLSQLQRNHFNTNLVKIEVEYIKTISQ